jgi:serine/threonine protein kinase
MSDTSSVCQQCGAPVTEGALFCSRCGVDVTAPQGADDATVALTAVGAPAPHVKATMRQMLRDATLGEYEILSELGRGGMATVFLAHDISLDRKVAIKVMAPHLLEGEGMAERFKLEARTAAQLSHPHIIPIYAVRETESALFFVMKYVEGKPLDEIIKKMGQLPIPMVKDILTKVGSALGYAHRRNVIHRDVKPGNIMIDEEGTPIVTDFGIAKVAATKGLTMTGTTIGTPSYMSPEQCEAKEVTGASDQYSLGAVAWEMLTGKTPFQADSAVTIMYKHCHEPLPPLQDFRPDAPPEVLDTITRMLAKRPEDRWPSLEAAIRKLNPTTDGQLDPVRQQLLELARDTGARELIAQLSTPRSPMPGLRTGASSGAQPTVQPPAPPRRSLFPVWAAAGILVAAGGGALAVLQPWRTSPPATVGPAGNASEPAAAGPGAEVPGTVGGGTVAPPSGGTQVAGGGAPPPGGGAPLSGSTPGGGAAPATVTSAPSPSGGAPPAAQPTTQPAAAAPRPATIAAVRVAGGRAGLEPGDQVTLSATAVDASGASVSGGAVRWSSSDERVGRVSADGTFTALGPGTAEVTAAVGNMTGRTSLTVGAATVASLAVDRSALNLAQGETATLSAEARARDGSPLAASGVTWRSDTGQVQAVGAGSATITASAGSASAVVRVTVAAPVVDARTAVDEIVAAYARALESRDINQVRRVYPGMTAQQERDLSAALPSMRAANLHVESLSEQGDGATARVAGTYTFDAGGRTQQVPVTFTATFQRDGSGWRMTRTQ